MNKQKLTKVEEVWVTEFDREFRRVMKRQSAGEDISGDQTVDALQNIQQVMAREISGSHLFKCAYWAAIRRDLVDSDGALKSVRSKLQMDDHEMVRTWAKHVSDVRLHDVLAWSN